MTTLDLARAARAHRFWLRFAYERGIYNDFDRTDRFGHRLPDPIAEQHLFAACAVAAKRAESEEGAEPCGS